MKFLSIRLQSTGPKYFENIIPGETIECVTKINSEEFRFNIPGPFSFDFINKLLFRIQTITKQLPERIELVTHNKKNYNLITARVKSLIRCNYGIMKNNNQQPLLVTRCAK